MSFSKIYQLMHFLLHVSTCVCMRRVENHAARAWQQAPPDAELSQEQSLASIEAALEVPAEASQLAQLSSRKARRQCIEQPQNPLQGHPRYRYVQDLSRCDTRQSRTGHKAVFKCLSPDYAFEFYTMPSWCRHYRLTFRMKDDLNSSMCKIGSVEL
jgi:hypothetical protein